MPDLSAFMVDLDTLQPNGGRGESPRSAFTKHNGALAVLENAVELDSEGLIPKSLLPAGVAGGIATLDADVKVPVAQLPAGIASGLATLDGSAKLTASQMPTNYAALLAAAFGYQQTLQNMTASRAAGVTYTNSTGRPISICVRGDTTAANGSFVLNIGGVIAGRSFHPISGVFLGLNGVVPAGASYVVATDNVSIISWVEYR